MHSHDDPVTDGGGGIAAQTIDDFLGDLAAGTPTPGGGAAAALSAATGAALVSMVCHLTIGRERYRAHEATMQAALAAAEELRVEALDLATADAAAYGAYRAASSLPKGTDEEKATRTARLQEALVGATTVPLRTVEAAARVVELCASVVHAGNPNVISDVGVGALCARAALDGAAFNVRINLASLHDEAFRATTTADLQRLLDAAHPRIETVLSAVAASVAR